MDEETAKRYQALELRAQTELAELADESRRPRLAVDRLVSDALAIEAEDARGADAIGYMARLLVQATMPHSKLEESFYQRKNGPLSLSIVSRPDVGLPYGHYPRLLLAWITTEAVRTRSPDLELGDSLSAFMTELGLIPSGGPWGSIRRLRDHMRRLFGATISWTYEGANEWLDEGIRPIERAQLWWDPKKPEQIALWRSRISLNRLFYDEIVRRPVPLDKRVLQALAHQKSPLAIDIYTWLTYRMSYLRRETTVPWELLELQFGGEYVRTRKFKEKFTERLRMVSKLYPEAKVSVGDRGLILQPSATHVASLPG